jgi:hypothetical protein
MPRELAPPLTETSFAQREARFTGPGAAQLEERISRTSTGHALAGHGAKQRAVQAGCVLVLAVYSVNRQSKLFEPRCFVPVPALKTNLAVHDVEEAAPTQYKAPTSGRLAGKLANQRAAPAPLDDSPLTVLENVFDPSLAVGERLEERGETLVHRLSSLDRLTLWNLDVRRVVMIESGEGDSVTLVEGGCPLCQNLFGRLHEIGIQIVIRNRGLTEEENPTCGDRRREVFGMSCAT